MWCVTACAAIGADASNVVERCAFVGADDGEIAGRKRSADAGESGFDGGGGITVARQVREVNPAPRRARDGGEELADGLVGKMAVAAEEFDAVCRPRGLPPGEVGDIWARGPNLMLGYWASAEDTASTLVNGWLHTGDIGHIDADGCLFLHGRSREILKVGAHRVSPQEIECCIQAVPGVRLRFDEVLEFVHAAGLDEQRDVRRAVVLVGKIGEELARFLASHPESGRAVALAFVGLRKRQR